MFDTRSYENYGVGMAADIIREEVASRGFSEGWTGNSLDVLEDMKEALQSDGILYVDDMFGRWARTEQPDLRN